LEIYEQYLSSVSDNYNPFVYCFPTMTFSASTPNSLKTFARPSAETAMFEWEFCERYVPGHLWPSVLPQNYDLYLPMSTIVPELPRYLELLSPADQERYQSLRSVVGSPDCRNNRNQRLDKFQEMLGAIRDFAEYSETDRSVRYLVCGVVSLNDGIAINIRQLRILLDKCKSSINGSFQRMGWIGLPLRDSILEEFVSKIPSLRANFSELREWSVRGYRPFSPLAQKYSPLPSGIGETWKGAESALPTPPPSLGEITDVGQSPKLSPNAWSDHEDPFCLTPAFNWEF
jgi:hypothetical protein